MPTIIINKEAFEKLVGKKLPIEKLKDRISFLGTDLEGIEGSNITVEIFPNRPDMLSVQGFARAFSSFIGVKTGFRDYKTEDSGEKLIVDKSVKGIRPYTACAIVKGIDFDNEKIKEVIDIQEKLHITFCRNRKKGAIGIYPFEKIKPPIYYTAKKPEDIKFRPLEFPKEINGRQILSEHPAGREFGHLLEGLDKFPIFIDSNSQILSMPPIINSHVTGKITGETKDVFIECSGFDINVLQKCLNMVVTALADMGGKIYSMNLVYPENTYVLPDLRPEEINVDIGYANRILGIKLNESELKSLLERMGYGYKDKKVLVPSYRADVLHQIDLVEDIAIAYGYDKFDEEIPDVATIGEENKFEVFKGKLADVLVGLNLLEVKTYHITNKDFQTKLMNSDVNVIELANSISAEYNVLKEWMIPSLLEIFKSNKHNDYPQRIFTTGTIFKKNEKTETGIEENERLAVALCEEKTDYTKIRQIFDCLMKALDLKYTVEEAEHSSFIPGRVARVSVKEKKVAYMGEISPAVLENWQLDVPVSAFELNLTELFELMREKAG